MPVSSVMRKSGLVEGKVKILLKKTRSVSSQKNILSNIISLQ
jgi:hypothetical protein